MKLHIGMRVSARFTDGYSYPAVIEEIDKDRVLVKFPNGDARWLPSANVTPR